MKRRLKLHMRHIHHGIHYCCRVLSDEEETETYSSGSFLGLVHRVAEYSPMKRRLKHCSLNLLSRNRGRCRVLSDEDETGTPQKTTKGSETIAVSRVLYYVE